MGRPMTDNTVMATFRINPEKIATIDEWAEDNELSRSELLRTLVDLGMAAWKEGKR